MRVLASVDAVVRRTSLSVESFDGLGSPSYGKSCDGLGSPSYGKLYDGHPCPSRLSTDWEVRRTVRLYDGHPCPSRLSTDWEVRRTVRGCAMDILVRRVFRRPGKSVVR